MADNRHLKNRYIRFYVSDLSESLDLTNV